MLVRPFNQQKLCARKTSFPNALEPSSRQSNNEKISGFVSGMAQESSPERCYDVHGGWPSGTRQGRYDHTTADSSDDTITNGSRITWHTASEQVQVRNVNMKFI